MAIERARIAALLGGLIPGKLIVPDLREINELDPTYDGLLQIVRASVAPAETQGAYWLTFELWVSVPNVDLETVEDQLEELADEVIIALDSATWLAWTTAERSVHPVNAMPAYRFEFRTRNNPTA
jgi:hypothetical protein